MAKIENDPLAQLLGELVFVDMKNGRKFCTKLIALVNSGGDYEVWFQRRNGTQFMYLRSAIAGFELAPKRLLEGVQ